MQTGSVTPLGGFSTTTEYHDYIISQDREQSVQQPRTSFKVVESLVPRYIYKRYDRDPFKLVCNELGLANLIVKSKDNLTVVEVIDLKWAYVAPARLFASAPWWVFQDRPTNQSWDCDESNDDQPPAIAPRYFRYLEIYKRVLEERKG